MTTIWRLACAVGVLVIASIWGTVAMGSGPSTPPSLPMPPPSTTVEQDDSPKVRSFTPQIIRQGRHVSGIWIAWYDLTGNQEADIILFGHSMLELQDYPHAKALVYLEGPHVYWDSKQDGINGNEFALDLLPTIPNVLQHIHGVAPPHQRVVKA